MNKTFRISENKYFEYQLEGPNSELVPPNDFFEFSVAWTRQRDHAGFDFTFSIYKLFWLNLNIYDCRHWDDETNAWKVYNIKEQMETDKK